MGLLEADREATVRKLREIFGVAGLLVWKWLAALVAHEGSTPVARAGEIAGVVQDEMRFEPVAVVADRDQALVLQHFHARQTAEDALL